MLKRYRRAIIISVITSFADITIRLCLTFDMIRVVPLEAILFFIAGALMLWVTMRDKIESTKARRFDLWLALFFFLGGIRSAIWALSKSISTANISILILGLIVGGILLFHTGKLKSQ